MGRPSITAPISGAAPLNPSVMPGIATPKPFGPAAESVASGVAVYSVRCVEPSEIALVNGFVTVMTSCAWRCDEPNNVVTPGRPERAAPKLPNVPPELGHQKLPSGYQAL